MNETNLNNKYIINRSIQLFDKIGKLTGCQPFAADTYDVDVGWYAWDCRGNLSYCCADSSFNKIAVYRFAKSFFTGNDTNT